MDVLPSVETVLTAHHVIQQLGFVKQVVGLDGKAVYVTQVRH